MKRHFRILSIALLTPIAALAIYFSYLWITYIDETVIKGTAYGFQIGDSKLDTYGKASGALLSLSSTGFTAPYIYVKVSKEFEVFLATESDYSLLVQTRLHDVGYGRFREMDTWEFYIDGSYFNSVKLKFCGGSLCKIHRHRKYFELP